MTEHINVAEWLAEHAGNHPEPYTPYTAQEQELILGAFGRSWLSPAYVLAWTVNAVGTREVGRLWEVKMPVRQDVKDRLRMIEKTSDKLFCLLWRGLQPAQPHEEDEPPDAGAAAVAEVIGSEVEKGLGLLRDLAWLSDRAAAASGKDGEAGRPPDSLRFPLEMLVVLWFVGHRRSKGEWRWGAPVKGRVNGPIGEFVRACTEPVLPPEEQSRVELVLHSVLKRHPKPEA